MVELLIERRPPVIPKSNKYLFARATKGSLGHLRGWDCISASVKEVKGIQKPEAITSTKLRKYIATVSQTAALMELDVDWLAHHLGHDITVLHESTRELAKVSKLLLAVDAGNIEQMQGKSLLDMSVEGM